MTKSETINELAQALLRVQKQLLPTVKDARNAFVGNTYATLNAVMESCREALFSQGILLTQLPCSAPAELGPGHIGLETMLTHVESGEWISSIAVIPLPKSDPQGMGSAITYARRYSLCAILVHRGFGQNSGEKGVAFCGWLPMESEAEGVVAVC